MPFIGKEYVAGGFKLMDSITASATASYSLAYEGVAFAPQTARHLIVSVNGVTQEPISAYTVSGSTITFTETLSGSDSIDYILALGDVYDVGVPSDDTVGTEQLKDTLTITNLTVANTFTQGAGDYTQNRYVMHGTTTGNTEVEIFTVNSNSRIPVGSNTSIFYEGSIVARRTDATGESGSWHLKGCADNFSGTVADVGSIYEIAVAQDDGVWAVDIRADDTNDAIGVYVTGNTSKTVKWTAVISTIEVAQ